MPQLSQTLLPRIFLSLAITAVLSMHSVLADELEDADKMHNSGSNIDSLRSIAQNPLSPVFSLPIDYTFHTGASNGDAWVLALKPIFPVQIGDINIINQMTLNFIETPSGVTGIPELPNPYAAPGLTPSTTPGSTGLGDMTLSSLVSPNTGEDVIWGLGGTLTLPTDHPSRVLGSGKWSGGPAFAILTRPGPWTIGVQGKQIWSFFGNTGREPVNQMQLKPFINLNLRKGWYFVSEMTMVANWDKRAGEKWTVPIGGGLGRLFNVLDQPVNTKLGAYWNAVKPIDGPDWSLNFTLQFLFPDT